jgi:hypothetical protein
MKKLLFGFLFFPLAVLAQKGDRTAEFAARYPEESAVYLERKENSVIKMEKGKPVIVTKTHEELLLISDKVTGYSERQVYYSSFSQVSGVKASALNPDGKGAYKTVPVKDKYVTNEFSAGSFYDDYKALNLVYTGLTKGSRMMLDYTEKLNEAHFFGRFYFSTGVPVEQSEFTVEVPAGVTIEWKLFNITQEELEFSVVEKKKKKIYTWRKKNATKYRTEGNDPGISWFAPHIVVYIKEYVYKGKTISYLNGPQGLYSWYYNFVDDMSQDEDPELRRIVDSLTVGVTDEFEKVSRIFYWVQDNIKYVAFEDGMGGFIPREAKTICDRRYGDCKDMANITTTMLKMAGIPAYLTWIGTRSIPYRYADVPSPMVDNHMICTYILNGTYYFLDATGKNAPIGTPTSMIQGKEAMIGMGEGKFEVVTVPVVPADKNLRIDSVFMNFGEHGAIKGRGSMRAHGYEKIHLIYPMDAMNQDEKTEFLTGYLEKGSNKFTVDTLFYDNLYDRDKDFTIGYDYSIDGYAHTNGNEMYVNMCLDKSYMNALIDTARRTAPLEIDYLSTERHVSVLNVPEGYAVSCMPKDQHFSIGDYSYSIKYRMDGNRLICEKEIIINSLMVQPAQFGQWNTFVQSLTAASNENVTLSKVKTPVTVTPNTKKK